MVIRKHTASTQLMIKKMDHAIKEAILDGLPFQMIKKKLVKTYHNAEANFKETKGLQRLYQKVSICYNFAAILSNILWEFLFLATKLFNFRCKIVKSSHKFVKNSRKFITFSREIVKFPKLGKTPKLAAKSLKIIRENLPGCTHYLALPDIFVIVLDFQNLIRCKSWNSVALRFHRPDVEVRVA